MRAVSTWTSLRWSTGRLARRWSSPEALAGCSRALHRWILFGGACWVVVGIYLLATQPSFTERLDPHPERAAYNLLVRGFRKGQASLDAEAPSGLVALRDPYDPAANASFRAPPDNLHDFTYYRGRLYLYFGVVPALVLFWPFHALSGGYLLHSQAVAIFSIAGFVVSAVLFYSWWRRYFPEVDDGVAAACVLAIGLADGIPVLLARSDVYEVAVSCGYLMTMLLLAALWRALSGPGRKGLWLAIAGAAYGLAVGARPTLVPVAVAFIPPLAQTWLRRSQDPHWRRRLLAELASVAVPVGAIAIGLGLYNRARFGNPFEFGVHYQLAGTRQDTGTHFSWRFLWFNFRVYFLSFPQWSADFPFVGPILAPARPAGFGQIEDAFGVLVCTPFTWMALLAGFALRDRPDASSARSVVHAAALLVAASAGLLGLYYWSVGRYEIDFLPVLTFLAAIGALGFERAASGRPWLPAARVFLAALVVFSIAFNLLKAVGHARAAYSRYELFAGAPARQQESLDLLENGVALESVGNSEEAAAMYDAAIRSNPRNAGALNNLGVLLGRQGRYDDALVEFQAALKVQPDYVDARNNFGLALLESGRRQEAIEQFHRVLQLKPDFSAAQDNLKLALKSGR